LPPVCKRFDPLPANNTATSTVTVCRITKSGGRVVGSIDVETGQCATLCTDATPNRSNGIKSLVATARSGR
jgi:hypothetical protein